MSVKLIESAAIFRNMIMKDLILARVNVDSANYFQKRILPFRFRCPRPFFAGEFLNGLCLPPATGEG